MPATAKFKIEGFRMALFGLAFLLPWHWLRLQLFGLPTNLWELALFFCLLFFLPRIREFRWQLKGAWLGASLLIVLGLVGGFLLAGDRLVALGIIKGWFLAPLLFLGLLSLNRRPLLEPLVLGLSSAGAFLAVVALIQRLTGDYITLDARASAIFSSANQLALFLVPVFWLTLGFLQWSKQSSLRLVLGLEAFLMLLALFFTFSSGAYLALLAGLFFFLFWRLGQKKGFGLGLVLILAGVGIVYQKVSTLVSDSSSLAARWQVWQVASRLWQENALLGVGLGNFLERYQNRAVSLFAQPLELLVPHAHNFFLQTVLVLGLAGLLGFLGVLYLVLRKASRASLWILPAWAAWLTQGLFDTNYYRQDLAVLFWLMVWLTFYGQKTSYRR